MDLSKINVAPIIAAIVAVSISGGKFDIVDSIVGIIFFYYLFQNRKAINNLQSKILFSMIFGLLVLAIVGIGPDYLWDISIPDEPENRHRYFWSRQSTYFGIWTIATLIALFFLEVNKKATE